MKWVKVYAGVAALAAVVLLIQGRVLQGIVAAMIAVMFWVFRSGHLAAERKEGGKARVLSLTAFGLLGAGLLLAGLHHLGLIP